VLFSVSNSDSTSAFLFIVFCICVCPTPKRSAILLELSPRSNDVITCTRSSRDNALRFWEAMAKTDWYFTHKSYIARKFFFNSQSPPRGFYSKVVSSYLQLTTYSKLHKLLLIKTFYPASYPIEENNQLPDLYTIGHWTVYTIVMYAPIVIKAQFRLQWPDWR